MKHPTTFVKTLAAAGLALAAGQASAHVVYPKALFNDTGANPAHNTAGANLTAFGTGAQTFTASSNVGWYAGGAAGLAQASAHWNAFRGGVPAGGTAAINGSNSHDNKFLYCALSQPSQISFTLTANNTSSGQTGTGLMQPAFSVYSGLAPYLSHDGAADNAGSSAYVLSADANGFAPFSQFLAETPAAGAGSNASLWGVFRFDASFGYGHDMARAATAVTAYPNGDPINGFDYTTMGLVGYATNAGLSFGAVSGSGGANTVSASFWTSRWLAPPPACGRRFRCGPPAPRPPTSGWAI